MASSASLFFDTIFNWDGAGTASSNYTDVTLEAQSPAGTTFDIFDSAAHYLYLGHAEKFDMAIFDLDTFHNILHFDMKLIFRLLMYQIISIYNTNYIIKVFIVNRNPRESNW